MPNFIIKYLQYIGSEKFIKKIIYQLKTIHTLIKSGPPA